MIKCKNIWYWGGWKRAMNRAHTKIVWMGSLVLFDWGFHAHITKDYDDNKEESGTM